jgi:Cu+-exporting ATPase
MAADGRRFAWMNAGLAFLVALALLLAPAAGRVVAMAGDGVKDAPFFTFIYNAAGVLFPALGLLLSPIIAAAAMALSSISVIAVLRQRHCQLPAPAPLVVGLGRDPREHDL